jgi:hypothetical protein
MRRGRVGRQRIEERRSGWGLFKKISMLISARACNGSRP